MKLRLLSRADVERLLTWPEAIRLQGEAFGLLSAGEAVNPVKTLIASRQPDAEVLFMPALLKGGRGFGLKYVSDFHGNAALGLPHLQALVLLLDGQTGAPAAILEGRHLTNVRTGAGAGLATQLLARRDAAVVAVFGAGEVAGPCLVAVCHVRPVRKVWVCSRSEAPARVFIERMRAEGAPVPADIAFTADRRRAVAEADVLVVGTNAKAAVFDGRDLRPGTHVNSLGNSTGRELDAETVRRSKVFMDSRDGCLAYSRDILEPIREGAIRAEDLYGELGEVVIGRKPGRTDEREITLFKSLGVAVQDLVTAQHVLREAQRRGIGIEVDL